MRKFPFIFAFLFAGLVLQAQSYRTAAGIRLGTDIGITIQQKIFKQVTIEGIFQSSLKREELGMTLLLEQHNKLISKRFNFYVGGGFHKNWVTDNTIDYDPPFGVSLIMGIEFTLSRLNFSWDYKPAINIWGGTRTFYSQTGLSLRYVFVKRKRKKINWKFWKKKGKGKKDKKRRLFSTN